MLEFIVRTFSVSQIRHTGCSETYCVSFDESFRDPVSRIIKLGQVMSFYLKFYHASVYTLKLCHEESLEGRWNSLGDGVGGQLNANRIILTELGHLPD